MDPERKKLHRKQPENAFTKRKELLIKAFSLCPKKRITDLHDDVMRALHAGQTSGRFKNNGGKRGVQRCSQVKEQNFINNFNGRRRSWGIFKGTETWTVKKRWVETLVEVALACNRLRGAVFWHPCWVIFYFFCQHLIFRVKDYISSGLHMKVTNPDGGIHSTGKTIRRYW